jgi:hypothetical protein
MVASMPTDSQVCIEFWKSCDSRRLLPYCWFSASADPWRHVNRQWHPKESVYEPRQPLSPEPPPDEDGGQADEQDATFLTAQTS